MRKSFLTLLLACFLLSPAWAQKKYFKWVDEDGHTHYSDKLPPETVNKATAEISPGGIVFKKKKAQSLEEIAKQKEEAQRLAEEQKLIDEARRKNRVLLDIYSNVEEIDLARERFLQKIALDIRNAEGIIANLLERQKKTEQEAALFQKRNQPVPEDVKQFLADVVEQIEIQQKFIINRQNDRANAQKKFDEEKARYLELTQKDSSLPSTATEEPAFPATKQR